jgi:hypothetical protein
MRIRNGRAKELNNSRHGCAQHSGMVQSMNEVNTYCHVRFHAEREKIARHLNNSLHHAGYEDTKWKSRIIHVTFVPLRGMVQSM